MPRQPSNSHLGNEKIFQVGQRVVYNATPYWKTDQGLWSACENKWGEVTSIERATFMYSRTFAEDTQHPWKYQVLFDGDEKPLTPAPENLHAQSKEPEWEV